MAIVPEQIVSEILKSLLQADAGVSGSVADGPNTYGPGVYHDSIPEGENRLPAIVYQLIPGDDIGPANCNRADIHRVTGILIARAAGRVFPWDILAAATDVLDGASGVYTNLAGSTTYRISRIGGIRPMSEMVKTKEYRAVGARFRIDLSPGH